MSKICRCQDSGGHVCGKVMTKQEDKQDGMCSWCADNVWVEITSEHEYHWYHSERENSDDRKETEADTL